MSEWCKEYIKLSLKTKTLERECSKIWKKVLEAYNNNGRSSSRRRTAAKKSRNAGASKSKSCCIIEKIKYSSSINDYEDEKQRINSRRLKLKNYCGIIKKTLNIITHNSKAHSIDNDDSHLDHEYVNVNKLKLEKVKKACKNAVDAYETEYESLIDFCNNEIQNLETQILDVSDSILSMEHDYDSGTMIESIH